MDRRNPHRLGFTITELLISVVLVLLLVAAIARIFNTTSNTIGRSEAIVRLSSGLDGVRTSLQIDFTGTDDISFGGTNDVSGILPVAGVGATVGEFAGLPSVRPQPAIILYSSRVGTFLNEQTAETDLDFDFKIASDPTSAAGDYGPGSGIYTVDFNENGIEGQLIDLNGDGDTVDPRENETLSRFDYGLRSFRTDTLSFFTSGGTVSQTDLIPGPQAAAAFESEQAWVWWGHGRLYNGAGPANNAQYYTLPGFDQASGATAVGIGPINPNNRFANEFALLRAGFMLSAPFDHDNDVASPNTVADSNNFPVLHVGVPDNGSEDWSREELSFPPSGIDDPTVWGDFAAGTPSTMDYPSTFWFGPSGPRTVPFSTDSVVRYLEPQNPPNPDHEWLVPPGDVSQTFPANAYRLQESRVDVIGASATQFHDYLLSMAILEPDVHLPLLASSGGHFRCERPALVRLHDVSAHGRCGDDGSCRSVLDQPVHRHADRREHPGPAGQPRVGRGGTVHRRVRGRLPHPGQRSRPVSAISEQITADVPDGIIDFSVVTIGGIRDRQTRFYGLPRDVNGDGFIAGPAFIAANPASTAQDVDVRPLADYMATPNTGYPFEKLLPGPRDGNGDARDRDAIVDYIALARDGDGDSAGLSEPGNTGLYERQWSQYLCVWGPMETASMPATVPTPAVGYLRELPYNGNADRNYVSPWNVYNATPQPLAPQLFRIVVDAADPQGRLETTIRQEVVFRLPHITP